MALNLFEYDASWVWLCHLSIFAMLSPPPDPPPGQSERIKSRGQDRRQDSPPPVLSPTCRRTADEADTKFARVCVIVELHLNVWSLVVSSAARFKESHTVTVLVWDTHPAVVPATSRSGRALPDGPLPPMADVHYEWHSDWSESPTVVLPQELRA